MSQSIHPKQIEWISDKYGPKNSIYDGSLDKNEKLFVTKKDLKDAILSECLEMSLSVLVVLVCDELAQEIKKMLL
jgi:hypothetical protein